MNLNPFFSSGLRAIALMLALFAAVPVVAGTVTTRHDTLGDNFAWVDSFDLIAFLGIITGTDTVKIVTATADDSGVLGYILLILQTQNAGGGGNSVS